jgi:hypothetical protein
VDDAVQKLRDSTESLSKFLMGAEMVLVEQFEEVIKEFERNYTELCTFISEFGQSSFARLREIETEYMEKFGELAISMYDRFNKGDIEDVDDDIRDVFSV